MTVLVSPLQGGEVIVTSGWQLKLARLALDLQQADVARLSDTAIETIRQAELSNPSIKEKTVTKLRRFYEKHGVEFIDENDGGQGVRLRKARTPR